MNTINLKLTQQKQSIINYLSTRAEQVAWEELAQFAKDPANVKLKTIKRAVSEIKRKYAEANLPLPFNCEFISLSNQKEEREVMANVVNISNSKPEQILVQVKRTPEGNLVRDDANMLAAHVDFKLDKYNEAVKTKYGSHRLSEEAYKIFALLHAYAGKPVTQEQLKDLIFPLAGSKLPHNWATRISGRLTEIRKNIPGIKQMGRLSSVNNGYAAAYMLV